MELPRLADREEKKYQNLLPSRPRICDPVNPTKNLYLTEIDEQKDKTKTKWSVLKDRIQHIDLSKTED